MAGLQLLILLPQPPKCWDYRCISGTAFSIILFSEGLGFEVRGLCFFVCLFLFFLLYIVFALCLLFFFNYPPLSSSTFNILSLFFHIK
jgi:hypothetical protein